MEQKSLKWGSRRIDRVITLNAGKNEYSEEELSASITEKKVSLLPSSVYRCILVYVTDLFLRRVYQMLVDNIHSLSFLFR